MKEEKKIMSKGLEALCYLDDIAHGRKMRLDPHELKLIVEKELQALEIIKKKPFNNVWFVYYKDYEDYYENAEYADESKKLTEEEWNFLKEVLL